MNNSLSDFIAWCRACGHYHAVDLLPNYLQYLKNVANDATNQKESKP